jgi:NADP-dependent 3-hydroxy acid dehydrogenase YdfG
MNTMTTESYSVDRRYSKPGMLIVIPGGTSGIGLATARILVDWGHRVVIGGRRKVHSDVLTHWESTSLLRIRPLDVCDQDSIERFFQTIESDEGIPQVLINCAGLMKLCPIKDLKCSEWEEMVNTNILGLLRCTAGILPLFQKRGGGKLINIGSVAAHKVATPDGTVYSATKFAVAALSEGMRQELAELNISVTLVSPGATKTQLGQNSSDEESKDRISDYYLKYGMDVEDVARQIAEVAVSDNTAKVSEVVLRSLHHRF